MNVFEAVKQSVTTRQAASYYGIRVGRNGMACCPFHNDRTPSMKMDSRYYCFGCGASGDVIDFAASLHGLGKRDAAVRLSYNQINKFPTELFATGSPIGTIILSGNKMTSIPENSLKPKNGNYKNTHLLTVIDLRFNKLTSLSDDFRATTLPYLTNMDVSYICFSKQ